MLNRKFNAYAWTVTEEYTKVGEESSSKAGKAKVMTRWFGCKIMVRIHNIAYSYSAYFPVKNSNCYNCLPNFRNL